MPFNRMSEAASEADTLLCQAISFPWMSSGGFARRASAAFTIAFNSMPNAKNIPQRDKRNKSMMELCHCVTIKQIMLEPFPLAYIAGNIANAM
jgi:hypothetical protein